jgi:hypothetical protein
MIFDLKYIHSYEYEINTVAVLFKETVVVYNLISELSALNMLCCRWDTGLTLCYKGLLR